MIDNTNFARNIKEPEILFTNDSTSIYLYLEKIRRNSFDGFISFDSDENSGKINIQGYAKISLNNTFNTGEKINFDFKSQKNQDRSLNSNVIFPYLFSSPFNLKYSLNLIRKDSSFTSNENSVDVELNLNKVKVGIGFQKNDSYGIKSTRSPFFMFCSLSEILMMPLDHVRLDSLPDPSNG